MKKALPILLVILILCSKSYKIFELLKIIVWSANFDLEKLWKFHRNCKVNARISFYFSMESFYRGLVIILFIYYLLNIFSGLYRSMDKVCTYPTGQVYRNMTEHLWRSSVMTFFHSQTISTFKKKNNRFMWKLYLNCWIL
jgi:hypothetical protein